MAFATCLIAGLQANNSLVTTVVRALVAMFGTLAVATVVGAMAERMLDENVAARKRELEKMEIQEMKSAARDR